MILEVKNLTFIADYYVICSADNIIHVKTIAENIGTIFQQSGLKPLGIEGLLHVHWVLMDYGDVIVHIFEEQTRLYYSLEKVWLDAPRIHIDDEDTDIIGQQELRELSICKE